MATLRERKPGVWEIRVFTGRDSSGRPTQTSRTVRGTKREAQRVAATLESRPPSNAATRSSPTPSRNELRQALKDLRDDIPAVSHGYAAVNGVALGDGALNAKTKEFALAIAETEQCDGCIASHARGAARRGATAEGVADALGVATLVNGGPGTVHAPRAFEAFHKFAPR